MGSGLSCRPKSLAMPVAVVACAALLVGVAPVQASVSAGSQPSSQVSSVSVALSTSAASVPGVAYTVLFTTSPTGGLASGSGQITLAAPTGTVFPTENVGGVDGAFINDVYDVTAGQDLGYSRGGALSNGGATATWTVEPTIPAGHEIRLSIDDVTNPAVGSHTLGVSTSADPTVVQSSAYATTTPQALRSPSASPTSSTAAGATGVTYTVLFTTSSTGELAPGGGQITLSAPAGTVFPVDNLNGVEGAVINDVYDVTAGQDLGYSRGGALSNGGTTATWTVEPLIPAGHEIRLTIEGMTNPAAGSHTMKISTSSDPTVIRTPSYSTTPMQVIGSPSLEVTQPAVAHESGVTYTVQFTTSSTGELVAGNGQITLTAPAGTVFPVQNLEGVNGAVISDVYDVTAHQDLGFSRGGALSDGGATGTWTVEPTIPAGHVIDLVIDGMTNPAAGTFQLGIATSSDTGAKTASYLVQPTTIPHLSGVVSYDNAGTTAPVAGSIVQACDTATCVTAISPTDADGNYSMYIPAPGDYTVTAFAPTSNAYSLGQGSTGPVTLAAGANTANITLPPVAPLPAGVTFNGQSGSVANVYWDDPAGLTIQGCAGGAGDVTVSAINQQTGAPVLTFGGLTEDPPGSGTYTTTIPPLYPSHGTASMTAEIQCLTPTALLPGSGPAKGGNTVQIGGSGFTGATKVMFGSTPAASFTIVSDSRIDAVAPPGSGTVPVSIVAPAGTISSPTLSQYTYLDVTSATPANGPAAGGTNVTLTGTDFSGVQAVYFGNAAASSVTIDSNTKLVATVPPGTGTVPVTVLTADGGQSAPGSATFTYGAAKAHMANPVAVAAPSAARRRSGWLAAEPAGSGTLTAVSPSAQVNYVAGEMLDHETAGCTGSGCAAFTTDVDQAASQYAQDVTNGTWIQPSAGSPLGCDNCQIPAPPGPVSSPGGSDKQAVPAGSVDLSDPGAARAEWDAARHWAFCGYGEDFTYAPTKIYCGPDNMRKVCTGGVICWLTRVDPSGTVEDTHGDPIKGATVTLLHSDGKLGPFTAPPSGNPIMDPSVNPETSDANGAFDWEVFAGYYQVAAQKAGCTRPGHLDQASVSTSTFAVPPPKVGIVLTLSCPGEPPPAKPKIVSLSARSGPRTGGTELDILGSGFTSSAVVHFGKTKAKTVQVLGPAELTVTTPPGTGTVGVQVTTAGGTSATSSVDRFSYQSPPVVTAIAPRTGAARGGMTITITGSGFGAGDQVLFGTKPATSASVVSPGRILATAPAGSGLVDIRVVSANGPSAKVAKDQFGYLAKPAFTSRKSTSAAKGRAFRFTVTTSGYPFARLSESGHLPVGLKFAAHANGTATIAGKSAVKGSYQLTITARNTFGTAKQKLTIIIK